MKLTLSVLFVLLSANHSFAADCTIRSCFLGGQVDKCWAKLQKEHKAKSKKCDVVKIGTGYSAYAMSTTLPDVCIIKTASIGIHRPYLPATGMVEIGSHWHNYYFDKINPKAVAYWRKKGGPKWGNVRNTLFTLPVPAKETGVPICK